MRDEFGLLVGSDMKLVSSEFHNEYLEYLAFFSSNSCNFYDQTDISKYDCPTGGFQCNGSETILVGPNEITYNGAVSYCNQQNESLCK